MVISLWVNGELPLLVTGWSQSAMIQAGDIEVNW